MNTFPKKSTKSLSEMWKLYTTLGCPRPKHKYVIDEVSEMLGNVSTDSFTDALTMMFPKKKVENGLEASSLFLNGLIACQFFSFQIFIEVLRGRS